jgi:hypothetical protein
MNTATLIKYIFLARFHMTPTALLHQRHTLRSVAQSLSCEGFATMRFPETNPDDHSVPRTRILACLQDQNSVSVSSVFLLRDSSIGDVELGFFANDTIERPRTREQPRTRNAGKCACWQIAVVLLVVAGSLSWLVSMLFAATASRSLASPQTGQMPTSAAVE